MQSLVENPASPFVRAMNLSAQRIDEGIDAALHAVRCHLNMDIGFISEFTGNGRVLRKVESKCAQNLLREGLFLPNDVGYCRKVVDGVLPGLIPDTARVPEALRIPETLEIPIGAHISVPIRLSNGTVFGTFCCFNFEPDPTLNARDLQVMTAFSEVVAFHIETAMTDIATRQEKARRIALVLASPEPTIVFQPIVDLATCRVRANEALARFAGPPERTPDRWFAEATEVDMSFPLELKAIRNAVREYKKIFDYQNPCVLHINCSPKTMQAGGLEEALEGFPLDCLVIELTEHQPVHDYEELARALAPLRERGARVAIDDVGAGYASMRHVLYIKPELIKLDVSLTRSVDSDRVKLALASAVCEFARKTGTVVVAEGVETEAEMKTLLKLGVDQAQGYYFGHPMPLEMLAS